MQNDMTLEELRAKAVRAGLRLHEAELQKLLPGVNRARKQVAELRQILSGDDEPASIFIARRGPRE